MKKSPAIFAIFLFMLLPLSGCVSDGSDGEQGQQGEQGLQGERGLDGLDGFDGTDGVNGTNGQDGIDGEAGDDGRNSLISTFEVLPGIHCENGGIGVLVGVDENGNGLLTSNEVAETTFVCNGIDSSTESSNSGSSSILLHSFTHLTRLSGCPAGGKIMMFGLDNGDNGAIAANGILESGEIDDRTTYCSTQRVSMIADIAQGNLSGVPGSFGNLEVVLDNILYFSANDGVHGSELWAYDLTTDTSRMIADVNSGANSSFPGYWLTVVHQSIIYFDAGTEEFGRELWAYDTTTNDYWMVADINEYEAWAQPGDDIEIVYGDTIYFSAFTYHYGTELWAHRPANNSTWIVEDIHHGSSSSPGWHMHFIHDDVLYFTARDMANVHDLWAHNQTNSTTWKVASFGMAPYTHPGQNMNYIVGDTAYFDVDDDIHGRELMSYNLTTNTARLVSDIAPGQASGNPGAHMSILIKDTLYFDAFDSGLWAYCISNDTTWRIHQFTDTTPQPTTHAVQIGNQIFFKTNDVEPYTVVDLWTHDIENGSTWMVANFTVPNEGTSTDLGIMETINGILYFDAATSEYGRELWAHDPEDGSTWLLANIHKADNSSTGSDPSSSPGSMLSIVYDGQFYFSANDGDHGIELWKMWLEHTITYS